jgi:hypothetical protein
MQRKQFPPDEASLADGTLEQFRLALHLLAAPATKQLAHFAGERVVIADELALDFDHWALCLPGYWQLSREQERLLASIDRLLTKMSDLHDLALWTDEALYNDPRWERGRELAQQAMIAFGWVAG